MIVTASVTLHVLAALLCGIAAVLLFRSNVTRSTTASRLVVAAVLLEVVAAALRWSATGHPPVFGTFENTMACSLALATLAVHLMHRVERGSRIDAAIVLVWVSATAAYGLFFSTTPYPLTISERSLFIDVHVFLAWSAYAMLLRACMTAIRTMLMGSSDAQSSDEDLVRAAGIGFALFTGMILVGAVYSFQLFTRYFSWEIVETLSVATWLAYALILHQRQFFGWGGRKLSILMTATLPLLVATFWTWSLFSGTYHYFEITVFRAW